MNKKKSILFTILVLVLLTPIFLNAKIKDVLEEKTSNYIIAKDHSAIYCSDTTTINILKGINSTNPILGFTRRGSDDGATSIKIVFLGRGYIYIQSGAGCLLFTNTL